MTAPGRKPRANMDLGVAAVPRQEARARIHPDDDGYVGTQRSAANSEPACLLLLLLLDPVSCLGRVPGPASTRATESTPARLSLFSSLSPPRRLHLALPQLSSSLLPLVVRPCRERADVSPSRATLNLNPHPYYKHPPSAISSPVLSISISTPFHLLHSLSSQVHRPLRHHVRNHRRLPSRAPRA